MQYIIRVDDRLIHGQVIEGWVKPLSIEHIVVCSDTVCGDKFAKTLYEMSVPLHVKLDCLSIVATAESLISNKYTNCLILIASLKELYDLVCYVKRKNPEYQFPLVNIGGIRYVSGRKQIYKALYLAEEDYNILESLCKLGIKLAYYVLPYDEKIVLNDKLNEIKEVVFQKNRKEG